MAKNALVTGCTGQTGAYLCKFLLNKGYKVFGTFRRLSSPNFWRLQYLGIFEKINLIPFDLLDENSIIEAIKISEPDEIYNLAAQSFVGASFEEPIATAEVSGLSVIKFLEVMRHLAPKSKFYQASTSELFGSSGEHQSSLNENSPLHPQSPYSAAKLYGYWATKIYRDAYDLFSCQGILFNHESPLRGIEFVTRKISNGVAKISLGIEKDLRLGNLEAKRDWGFAPDYVSAIWKIMQYERADDFVIASGESHSIREFAEEAFRIVGLSWEDYVKTDKRFLRPLEVNALKGDYSKAKKELNWEPKIRFKRLVKIMVDEDVKRWSKWQKGDRTLIWDAPFYPSEANIITRSLKV